MNETNINNTQQNLNEKIESLNLEIDKLNNESKNNWELFVRCKAEMENLKKRTDKEILNTSNFALQNILCDFIPLLDSFELCFKKKTEDNLINIDGVILMHKMLLNILDKYNLKKISTEENEKLDISKHEAISVEYKDDIEEDDTIKTVLQNGYILNDRVLRYVKVSVLKRKN
ncbi:nucleotide exchange factor GrpE [Candidatus Azoamicus ciliaticola]|uniref:Protein GrpE n=1 Tax=Candidatus Azoamicus ciliaticola TaxID=2652803 RepID=A0A6J5JWW8_9GAMM|nr:nucleotide exchange factor GrpE [Candidatus Azoamicus ciliaticola]CAB3976386.1 Protein GrpE [Candidatus Azoamicus ciliaticola]